MITGMVVENHPNLKFALKLNKIRYRNRLQEELQVANSGLEEYRRKLKEGIVKKTRDKNRPSTTKAIKENCKECMSDYVDGRQDCELEKCPLYYFMPYGRLKKERKIQKQLNKTKIVTEETEEKY